MNLHLKSLLPGYLDATIESQVWNREMSLEPGSHTCVYAVSGKGKTSLISILCGMLNDFTGTAWIGGRDIRSLTRKQWQPIRRETVSTVFQDLKVFENLTAFENLRLKAELTGYDLEKAREMAEMLGISHRLDRPCGSLSLGERQRLAIIRAMCQPFSWLLLDEPFSHLDDGNRAIAYDLIRSQCKQRNAGVIMTALLKPDEEYFDNVLAL